MPLAGTHHRQRWMIWTQERFGTFGDKLPKALSDELGVLEQRLGSFDAIPETTNGRVGCPRGRFAFSVETLPCIPLGRCRPCV